MNLSIHSASCSQLFRVGSSPLLGWPVHYSPFAWGLCSTLITRASSLLHPSPPQCVASGTLTFGFHLGILPFPEFSLRTTTRLVPEFNMKAGTTLMPPIRRTPPGQNENTRQTHPGAVLQPSVLMSSQAFRRVIGWFAFSHLRSTHLTEVPPPF